MSDEQNLLEHLRAVAAHWRSSKTRAPSLDIQRDYNDTLQTLYATGWDYALGWVNELPDEYLPERYRRRRSEILDQLENELGPLAIEYRSSIDGSAQERHAIQTYGKVMDEMFRIGHWHGEPDIEAQLPDNLMPQAFHEFRRSRLRKQAADQEGT